MARKTSCGTFILSAGEIGSYTVCPEQWRLKTIDKVKGERAKTIEQGQRLHEEWAKNYSEAIDLAKYARYILLALLSTVAIFLFIESF